MIVYIAGIILVLIFFLQSLRSKTNAEILEELNRDFQGRD